MYIVFILTTIKGTNYQQQASRQNTWLKINTETSSQANEWMAWIYETLNDKANGEQKQILWGEKKNLINFNSRGGIERMKKNISSMCPLHTKGLESNLGAKK